MGTTETPTTYLVTVTYFDEKYRTAAHLRDAKSAHDAIQQVLGYIAPTAIEYHPETRVGYENARWESETREVHAVRYDESNPVHAVA